MPAPDFAERMQVFRLRRPEKTIPGFGAKAYNTRQPTIEGAKADAADERGEIATQASRRGRVFPAGVHGRDQKNGGARKRSVDGLR
jgi:hypothetical protein